jgi:hypothetical protein
MPSGILLKTSGRTPPNPSRNIFFHRFPISTHLLRVEAVLKGRVVVRGLPLRLPKPLRRTATARLVFQPAATPPGLLPQSS